MKTSIKMISLFLLIVLLCGLVPVLGVSAADAVTVTFSSPALSADAGTTVDLTSVAVEFSAGTATAASGISWSSDELIITSGKVTPSAAGVYRLNASASGKSKTVYLVVKNPSDTEYVLYSNDFSDSSMSDFRIIQQTSGATAAISGGVLTLDASSSGASYVRLLFPAFLGDFGDYKIEASMKITAATDSSKWMSMMFRIQKSDYPYWQMCVRQNASAANGSEIAERTSANAWNVTQKGSYTEALSSAKFYTLCAEVRGKRAATYINNERLLFSDTMTYTTGEIGFQVRGVKAIFDSVKVSLTLDDVAKSESVYYEVEDPSTNIILSPSVISYIDSAEKLSGVSSLPISTAIFYADKNLNVTNKNGNTFSTVSAAMEKLNKKIIPAFYVRNSETVGALCKYFNDNGIEDVFVLSDDTSLVAAARKECINVRGVVDFSTSKADDLYSIRSEANTAGARVAILSADTAAREDFEYLQRLFITVWTDNSATSGNAALVNSITAGANGIITSDPSALEKCFTEYFEKNSMIRAVNVIGHRGAPSMAQENSLDSAIKAYEAGATMIENDIYLSTDGVIYVMHDATVDRTTNGTGNISSMTSAQIDKLAIDVNTAVPTEPVPTLEDYFKEFKGKDAQIIIEIKTRDLAIIPVLTDMIKKYDIADQVNVISFSEAQIKYMKKTMPEISAGYLSSSVSLNESDPLLSLQTAMRLTQRYDTTFNPSYASGALGYNFLRAASYRGLTVWPWTINTQDKFDTYFMYGTYGITTNYSQFVTNYVKSISAPSQTLELTAGETVDYSLTQTTYGRKSSEINNAKMIVIEGAIDGLNYSAGKLTATGTGSAIVIFRTQAQTTSGSTYYLYTQPLTITASGASADTTTSDTLPVGANTTSPSSPDQTPDTPSGNDTSVTTIIIVAVICVIITAAVVTIVIFVINKKKAK